MDLSHGDVVERQNLEWIRNKLPHYEEVWMAFIGHDGNGSPPPIPGLPDEVAQARARFYEAHYSMLPKLIRVDTIAEDLAQNFDRVSAAELHEATERLFDMMTAVGYVRDMFGRMDAALNTGGALFQDLNDLYHQRSHVTHGPRLPIKMDGGFAKVPRLATSLEGDRDWTDESSWDDIDDKDLVFLADFASEVRDNLFATVNRLHGRVFDAADRRFLGKRVPSVVNPGSGTDPNSGVTGTQRYTISGIDEGPNDASLSASQFPRRRR